MKDERPVPFEKWALNFRVNDLGEGASAWESARAWIAEGLLEWGNDDVDPEEILLLAYEQRRMEQTEER